MLESIRHKNVISAKKLGCSTIKVNYADGSIAIRYHFTDVLTWNPGGSVTLDTGGHYSPTTKKRINDWAGMTGLTVYQDKGIWYVRTGSWTQGKSYDFYNGITFLNGELVGEPQPTNLQDIKRIKQRIARFVKLLDQGIPTPDGGDCWGCKIFDSDDCLEGHLEEGYMHGSLIVRALKAKGYQDRQLPYVIQHKDIVKRALRRFLTRKLIPNIASQ
jgi:hypothetical protein